MRFCERGSRLGEGKRGTEAMFGGLPEATGGSVAVRGGRAEGHEKEAIRLFDAHRLIGTGCRLPRSFARPVGCAPAHLGQGTATADFAAAASRP